MAATYYLDTSALVKRYHVERHHIHAAQQLILRHGLRTLYSIQLSLLLVTKSLSLIFLCSDARLLAAARAEGITAQDPSALT
jgi:predicted nucleic acid-binding protein